MKNKMIRTVKNKALTVVFITAVFLFSVIFMMTAIENMKKFTFDAARLAETQARESVNLFDANADTEILAAQTVAAQVRDKNYNTQEQYDELNQTLAQNAKEYGFLSLTAFDSRGEHHYMDTENASYFGDGMQEAYLLAKARQSVVTSVYRSNAAGKFCVAVYAPVSNKTELGSIECICAILDAEKIYRFEESKDPFSKGNAQAFIVGEGDYYYRYGESNATGQAKKFADYLSGFASVETASQVKTLLSERNFGSMEFSAEGTAYVLAFSRLGDGADAFLAVIYDRTSLLSGADGAFAGFIVSVVVLALLVALALFTDLFEKHRVNKQRMMAEDVDPILKCSTYSKFKRDCERLILDHRASHYAMICVEIYNFKYIQEHFGEDVAEDAKRFTSSVFDSVLQKNETFGHLSDDSFVVLLRYEVKSEISSRITLICELINHYTPFRKNNFFCLFNIGVYYILPAENVDADAFLNRAHIAQTAHKKTTTTAYVTYDQSLYENYRIQSDIESKMEGALKNCDFHLFYQPKYHIFKESLDGAETLVRWFDSDRGGYVPPQKFIPLFELNGFINKLDRYVFIHSCEFFANAMRNGLRVTPLSVNVSRVTAIQKDFVAFYSANKAKYNIPDGYITIEFTESFSFTNLDVLSAIVFDLQKHGFKCSIDDFGSGYSSCGILKELPVEELKLDMFLLKPSQNTQKDEALIEMMIKLGKAFEMKVTQEGVETIEQFDMLKKMGCDVIQGYLYSRPLLSDDFQSFVNGATDLDSVMKHNVQSPYRMPKYIDFSIK